MESCLFSLEDINGVRKMFSVMRSFFSVKNLDNNRRIGGIFNELFWQKEKCR